MAEPPPLREALRTPESKHRYVAKLFSTIADRYDFITVLLSCGQDRRWKERLVSMASSDRTRGAAGVRALDLACGTGDIAYALHSRGAQVVGLDLTRRMIELARAKVTSGSRPAFLVGDMMSLPFPSASFDVVTTGYGLRNVPVIAQALGEIRRVLRPDGLLLSLDFNRPANPLVRSVYLTYLTIVGSTLGFVLHGDPDTYRYIPESIRRYPGAAAVCDLARAEGFAACEHLPVLGGLMSIHKAKIADERPA
jgi:demethylmenaquinone methyltransferase / 2-methoxy-6-polyprenyl-1,4-benzoquinol methylase